MKKDLADVCGATSRYLTGLSDEKPKIGRFGYAEKMEYWAVVWGTIIMGVTGLMIWFKMDVTRFLPRWAVDVALTIHYYEAMLACLAIVVWHFYHVIFDPDVYPLNSACWNGNVSEQWQKTSIRWTNRRSSLRQPVRMPIRLNPQKNQRCHRLQLAPPPRQNDAWLVGCPSDRQRPKSGRQTAVKRA